ncbi:MAG: hypothetical protein ACE5HD_04255 [Acidobacteriota bacterium]
MAPLLAPGIDWLPRLLLVAASTATAYLLVRIGRRWLGPTAAHLAGLLFALSLLDIQWARQTRMYALYQLAALAAFFSLYLFWTRSRAVWGWTAAA